MKPLILKIKDFTRFNNELFKPMEEARRIIQTPFEERSADDYSIRLMESVAIKLDGLMCELTNVLTKEAIKEILNENSIECPTCLFKKVSVNNDNLEMHSATQYYNYIVERGNWALHWYMINKY